MRQHYRPNRKAIFTELREGEGVLLHLDSKLYYSLNGSGVFLWRLVEKNESSESELISGLIDHYQIPKAQAQSDVQDFLKDLLREKLLDVTSDSETPDSPGSTDKK